MIIGICGQKGSGKDTIANKLIEHQIVKEKKSIADGIRLIRDLFFYRYIKDDQTTGENNRGSIDTKVLIDIGHALRSICQKYFNHEKIFLDYLNDSISEQKQSFVISDIRLLTEADYIIKNNGTLILILTDEKIRRTRCEKRNKKKFSDQEWNEIANNITETNIWDIMKKYDDHPNALKIPGILSPETIIEMITDWLMIKNKK